MISPKTVFVVTSVIATLAFADVDLQKKVHFATETLQLGKETIVVEIADTDELRERGLMGRSAQLADNHGMLFVFPEERVLAFWMKNTLIPLSIGYFNGQGELLDLHEMEPAAAGDLHPPAYESVEPAQYALEMQKGWFKKHKIKIGARLKLPKKTSKSH